MDLRTLPINWFDFLVVLVLILGVARGRQRGMSEEALDLIHWLLVLAVGAVVYEPVGRFLEDLTVFSRLTCYLTAYASVVVVIGILIAVVRSQVGDKLLGGDVFGNGEYYLGMAAGAVRYGCVLLVALAFLNARYYSPEELRVRNAAQERYFGDIRFPTLDSLQAMVFQQSFLGRQIRNHLSGCLIQPTSPGSGRPLTWGAVRGREQQLHEVLEKK